MKFSKLSEEAQQRAIQNEIAQWGYHGEHEAKSSLEILAEYFSGKLQYSIMDFFNSSYSSAHFTMPDVLGAVTNRLLGEDYDEDDMIDIEGRLAALGTFDPVTLKGHGECKLTGVWIDEEAIDGFRAAFHAGERDLEQLMQAAFRSLLAAAQEDCKLFYSIEEFSEHCDANDLNFTANGKFLRKRKWKKRNQSPSPI